MCEHAQRGYDACRRTRDSAMVQAVELIERFPDPFLATKLARFRSNAVRRTRQWLSEPTDYHYPGLAEFEFRDRANFPWLKELEAAFQAIRREFKGTPPAERGGGGVCIRRYRRA